MKGREMSYPPQIDIFVNITQSDIEHGQKSDCLFCPGARAALRKLQKHGLDVVNMGRTMATTGKLRKGAKLDLVHVADEGYDPTFYNYDKQWPNEKSKWLRKPFYECVLPDEMHEWIDNFDENRPVEPASFRLVFTRLR